MSYLISRNIKTISLISRDREISYAELHETTEKISSNLDGNSLVFLVCSNSIGSIIAYLSIIKSGSSCAMIKERNFDYLFDTYKPLYIFAPRSFKKVDGEEIIEYDDYVLYRINNNITYSVNKDLSILLSTSGSTGSPKFVKITSQNLISNTMSISKYLNISSCDRAITTMPMNYSYGLSIINTHLANGASIIITDASLMNKELWDLMKEKKATNFGGVPYTFQMLKNYVLKEWIFQI